MPARPRRRSIAAARTGRRGLARVRSRAAVALALGVGSAAGCESDLPTAAPSVAPRADVAADSIDPSYIAPIEVSAGEDGYFVTGTVVARFRPGASAAQVAAAHGASVRREMLLPRAFVLGVPAGRERATARALAQNPNVEFAEPDYVTSVAPCAVGSCTAPSSPAMGFKWDLNNDGEIVSDAGQVLSSTGVPDADIDWLETFDHLGPSFAGTARLGIIDTGIYPSHADLLGKVVAAQNFATSYPSNFTVDRVSHGTHVAGIAAAHGHDGGGVTGVAYGTNVKLINAKACELYLFPDQSVRSSCPTSSTANAIVWATDQGANVLNLSFSGSPTATSGSAAQQAALRYARSKNVLPFCSAGNDNSASVGYPARFPECVAVAATNWSDGRAGYSNYASQVALAAPGGDVNPEATQYSLVLSTSVDFDPNTGSSSDDYLYMAGTSMAAPQAAGLAALLFASGMSSADDVLARMEGTADDLGAAGRDAEFGYGRINAYRAVTLTDPDAPPVAAPGGSYAADEGRAVQFDGGASSDPNGRPLTYAWSFGDGDSASGAAPTHVFADDGEYAVTLTVTDESGRSDTKTTTAVISNVEPTGGLTTSAAGGRVVVGTPVALSFADVTDPSTADVAAGISATYSCGASGGAFTAESQCATPNVGTLAVRGTLTDKDGGATTYGPTEIAVVPAATTVAVENASAQYSDAVTLTASLAANAGPGVATSATGTMEFFVDGVSVGTEPVLGTGAVTHSITLAVPASSHAVTARYTSTDANYAASALSTPATLAVAPEATTLTYAPTNAVAKQVASPGGTADAFSLVVSVAEVTPEAPAASPGAGLPGDVNLAPVKMTLVPIGSGSSVTGTCAGAPAPAGYAAKTYACSFPAGVPVNTYAVQTSVSATPAGTYYGGGTEDVLTIYDPSLGYTTGGGSFAWPGTGERTTFGFTIKYNKGGSNLQGSLLVVRHAAGGAAYRLKSNALDGMALSPATSGGGSATFSGKATYIEPGWATAQGNVAFTAYVVDGSEAGGDGLWLQTFGGMSMAGAAGENAQPLTGGNIVVQSAGP